VDLEKRISQKCGNPSGRQEGRKADDVVEEKKKGHTGSTRCIRNLATFLEHGDEKLKCVRVDCRTFGG
jgi:hypothetical protein